MIPEITQGTSKIESMLKFEFAENTELLKPVIKAADIDGDHIDEIVVGYITNDYKIRMEVYSIKNNDSIFLSYFNEQELDFQSWQYDDEHEYFNILVSDFDGNGDKEVSLIRSIDTYSIEERYQLQVYDFTDNTDTTGFIKVKDMFIPDASGILMQGIVTDMDQNGGEEISFYINYREVLVQISTGNIVYPTDSLHISEFSLDVSSFYNYNRLYNGDFDGDGISDLMLINDNYMDLYTLNNDNPTKFKLANSINNYFSYKLSFPNYLLSIADFNSDNIDDIALVRIESYVSGGVFYNPEKTIDVNLYVYTCKDFYFYNTSFQKQLLNNFKVDYELTDFTSFLTLLADDFSGDNFDIGEGSRYVKEKVMQPIVILNAPPMHFDILGDETVNLNQCFNEDCSSQSLYSRSTSSKKTIGIEVSNNYNFSASVSGGGTFLGIGAEAYINSNYGSTLRKSSESTKSFETEVNISAVDDDKIYATITDYEIWTYPVYSSLNQEYIRSIVCISPIGDVRTGWFPSKGDNMVAYRHTHEHGNILSYQSSIDMNGPTVAENVKDLIEDYELSSDENTFSLNWEETFSKGASSERNISVEIGGSLSAWGIEVGGSASFNNVLTSTHNVSIEEGVNIEVNLGTIYDSQKGYTVKPYVYWNNQGAMVLDFATIISENSNWWNQNYGGLPDPAFILPWKYENEKGLTDEDLKKNDLYLQTRSIRVAPYTFSKGDTVLISATINNYSLLNTEDPVEVGFYLGSPEYGGSEIIDVEGYHRFLLDTIKAKEQQTINIYWVATENRDDLPRLYALIDPDNKMTEIHEDNNMGWIPLGKDEWIINSTHKILSGSMNPESFSVIYPNPVSSVATIDFELHASSFVEIMVSDISGRFKRIIASGDYISGNHSVNVDMSGFTPGVYFYSLRTPEIYEVRKFIVME